MNATIAQPNLKSKDSQRIGAAVVTENSAVMNIDK